MGSKFTCGVQWDYFVWELSICQCHIGVMFANKHRNRNTSGRKSNLMTGRDVKNVSFLEDFTVAV